MPLPPSHAKTRSRQSLDALKVWNRKGHYYLGLYFLFFLWLFTFTGLLLNHSWQFSDFWPQRKVSTFERNIDAPHGASDLERARDVVRQLGIAGEVEWTAARPDSPVFEFRVNRPGHNFNVAVDTPTRRAKVEQTTVNAWGVMRILHTFTGARAGDKRNERDWILTTVWVLSMDAVSAGLILMVLTGLYMWWGLTEKRNGGIIALVLGTAVCSVFVFGLSWIYR